MFIFEHSDSVLNLIFMQRSSSFLWLVLVLVLQFFLVGSHSPYDVPQKDSLPHSPISFRMNTTCTGSLGENIFSDGDFGSGSANIPTNDPGIAPGYTYARSGPPMDGFYLITNNTGAWPNLYASWIRTQDNSDDPNGYMMVVNASFSPGLFYQQEITGLCENTLYEFSADIINIVSQGTQNHILPNVSFLINGQEAFSTGNIPQDNKWNTYGFTFTTDPGTTTLTLSIRNNAPGGFGNDLALDNITFRACGPDAVITPVGINYVCVDADPVAITAEVFNSPFAQDFIQWESSIDGGLTWEVINGASGLTYTIDNFASGTYLYRFQLAASPENLNNDKCRVLSETATIIVLPLEYEITDTICAGLNYSVGTSIYTESGVYRDSLQSSIGCDSIVTLNLTVLPDPMITAELNITSPVCAADGTGSIIINSVRNGYPPYLYQLDNGVPQSQNAFVQLDTTDYILTITDRFGCSSVQAVNIPTPPLLEVDLGENQVVQLGESLTLSAISNYTDLSYSWTPNEILSCLNCPNPDIQPLEDLQVTVEVMNTLGCTAIDSMLIKVVKNYPLYAPNVFSPNDDGINDYFTIFSNTNAALSVQKLQVFDRWGKLLFERNDFPLNEEFEGWDGYWNGKLAGVGVYVYVAEVTFIDNTVVRETGSVAVIR